MSSKTSVPTAAASVIVGAVLALAVAFLVQPRGESKNVAVPTSNRTAEEGLINWVRAKGGTVSS